MPESLWVCRVKEFGPLIVSIDTHGNNLIAETKSCSLNVAILSSKKSASTCTTSNNPPGGVTPLPLCRDTTMAPLAGWWRYGSAGGHRHYCCSAVPTGLESHTWLYFAVFTGVIVGLILEPVPGAVVAMIGISIIAVLSPWLLFSPEQLAQDGFKLLPNRCRGRYLDSQTRSSG